MNDIRELSIHELDAVSGGMDCKTGIAIAETYSLASKALQALGNSHGASVMYGRSVGVAEASCGVVGRPS